MYVYRSYRKVKTGVGLYNHFLDHSVYIGEILLYMFYVHVSVDPQWSKAVDNLSGIFRKFLLILNSWKLQSYWWLWRCYCCGYWYDINVRYGILLMTYLRIILRTLFSIPLKRPVRESCIELPVCDWVTSLSVAWTQCYWWYRYNTCAADDSTRQLIIKVKKPCSNSWTWNLTSNQCSPGIWYCAKETAKTLFNVV